MDFDGYHIVKKLHLSHCNHLYLAIDSDTVQHVALKIPSTDLSESAAQLNCFALECLLGQHRQAGCQGFTVLQLREILHQDLRQENIMIDRNVVVKIIGFGAVYVASLE